MESMLKRLLKSLAVFVVRQPWLTTALYLAAAAGSVPQILELNFKTDQNDLVAADLEYNQRYLDFLDEFGDLEFLYVVIETGADQQAALAAARDARERIERLEEHVDKAVHRIPPEAMRYGILHREPEELASLSKTLAENRDLLGQLGKTSRLEDLFGFFSSLLDPETIDRRFGGKAEESDGVDAAATALALLEDSLKATRDALEGRKGTSLSSKLEERQPGTNLYTCPWCAHDVTLNFTDFLPAEHLITDFHIPSRQMRISSYISITVINLNIITK